MLICLRRVCVEVPNPLGHASGDDHGGQAAKGTDRGDCKSHSLASTVCYIKYIAMWEDCRNHVGTLRKWRRSRTKFVAASQLKVISLGTLDRVSEQRSQRLEQHDKTTRTTWRKHQTPPCRTPGMIMCCMLLFLPCCFHVWREMDLSCDTCTCDSCISVEDKITGVEEHVDIDMTDACARERHLPKCNGCSRPFIRRRASRHKHRENQLHDRKMRSHPWKHVEQPLINPRMHVLIQALVHLLPLARCLTHGHAPVVMPVKIILLAAATDWGPKLQRRRGNVRQTNGNASGKAGEGRRESTVCAR